MTVSAKIVLDSIGPCGVRLVTIGARYPRIPVHEELMTHKIISKSASSSRAIPFARMVKDVMDDPFIPLSWGKNQKGMQADVDVDKKTAQRAESTWLLACKLAAESASALHNLGIHKQLANRLIQPWTHISVVLTAVDMGWQNFFALRCHKMAEPTMQLLAWAAADAYYASTPNYLHAGQWHLPYVPESAEVIIDPLQYPTWIKASVARCARTSYSNHDGTVPDIAKDIELHDRLLSATPMHASPAEHQGQAWSAPIGVEETQRWKNTLDPRAGNFIRGWTQYRKTLKGECATFDYATACREQR